MVSFSGMQNIQKILWLGAKEFGEWAAEFAELKIWKFASHWSHPVKSERVMEAVLKMNKIDIAALKQVYEQQ